MHNPREECNALINYYLPQVFKRQIKTKSDVRIIINQLRDLQMDLIAVSWKEDNEVLEKFGVLA